MITLYQPKALPLPSLLENFQINSLQGNMYLDTNFLMSLKILKYQ